MKLAYVLLAALGVAIVAAGSCAISHRSGDFTCQTQADCSSGRVCSDGLCVASPLDSGVKGDAQSGDANGCPMQCTSCDVGSKTCFIDCMLNNGACTQPITCPSGWNCNVKCSTDGACRSGINCQGGNACTITCSGSQSCRNITCGTGPCKVDCTGNGSCSNVNCGLSCACDVTCRLQISLCTSLTCKTPQCTLPSPPGGCTSTSTPRTLCNSCP